MARIRHEDVRKMAPGLLQIIKQRRAQKQKGADHSACPFDTCDTCDSYIAVGLINTDTDRRGRSNTPEAEAAGASAAAAASAAPLLPANAPAPALPS